MPTVEQPPGGSRTGGSDRSSQAGGRAKAPVRPHRSRHVDGGGRGWSSAGGGGEGWRGPVHGLLWGAFGLVITLVIVIGAVQRFGHRSADDTALPQYGRVPDFSLTERSGRPVTAADLHGRIWVANFIFTKCDGMCPILSTKMAALQRQLQGGDRAGAGDVSGSTVQLVSVSVDPVHDTPAVLRRYAERFGADGERWLFVTGARSDVHRLVRDGFHLSIEELAPEEAARARVTEPIIHSDRFVLVDRQLEIRGYYHGTDEADMSELRRHIAWLRDRDVDQ